MSKKFGNFGENVAQRADFPALYGEPASGVCIQYQNFFKFIKVYIVFWGERGQENYGLFAQFRSRIVLKAYMNPHG